MSALALAGGLLGILFMIPLRRFLIVEEHDRLPYPEGTACAKVLVASEEGGARSGQVYAGLAAGVIYKFIISFGEVIKEKVDVQLPFLGKAQIGLAATPAPLGVGYILGYRISHIMVTGSLSPGWFSSRYWPRRVMRMAPPAENSVSPIRRAPDDLS